MPGRVAGERTFGRGEVVSVRDGFRVLLVDDYGDDCELYRVALARQYRKLFELDGIPLTVEPEALEAIARRAAARRLGARGLRTVLEEIMLEPMFSPPSTPRTREFVVTRDLVEESEAPLVALERAV